MRTGMTWEIYLGRNRVAVVDDDRVEETLQFFAQRNLHREDAEVEFLDDGSMRVGKKLRAMPRAVAMLGEEEGVT
jgi:hypothetical protein